MSASDPPGILWRPADLKERLGDANLRLIDARPAEAFAMGHIPGAASFDLAGLACDDTDEAPLAAFSRRMAGLFGRRGVTLATTVVFYDGITGPTAARGFWLLDYFGHADVHVLNGGYAAWQRAGLPTTGDAEAPKGATFDGAPLRDRVATHRDVLAAAEAADRVVLDTRSDREWRGIEVRGARGGAVPGARHLNWTEHLARDKALKPLEELRALYESRGITPEKEVIPYCQTGYRSAHAYLVLRLLGYPRVRNYVGSWNEWARRPELPVITPEA